MIEEIEENEHYVRIISSSTSDETLSRKLVATFHYGKEQIAVVSMGDNIFFQDEDQQDNHMICVDILFLSDNPVFGSLRQRFEHVLMEKLVYSHVEKR